jgi:methionyl-tRNA formyltransferase
LKKEQGRIDWALPAVDVERHIRAMSPWPGAFTRFAGKGLKVHSAEVGMQLDRMLRPPGTVFQQRGETLVACGGGALKLIQVQAEGKAAMAASVFANGQRAFIGAQLGA